MPVYPRVITWARGLALASFILLAALVYVRYTQAVAQLGILTSTQAIGVSARTAMSLVIDAETGAWGYVITGDDRYLEPYRRASAELPGQVANLRRMMPSDASQQEHLASFLAAIEREQSVLERTIDTRRNEGFEAARAYVATNEGRSAMDRARAANDTMLTGLRSRAQAERSARLDNTRTTRYLMLFLFFFAIGLLTVAGVHMRRELGRRAHAEQALHKAYDAVEERVRLRTQELVETNMRLESSERRAGLITGFGVVHLFTMNAGGWTEYVTSGFTALTGLDDKAVLGLGWFDAVEDEDRARLAATWEGAINAGVPFETVFRLRTAAGQHRWFKMRAMPVTGDDGRIAQWVGAAIDMHDQQELAVVRADLLKREQAARADAEMANRLKDEFLATVSHELRTPLNAIVGWAHLLKSGLTEERAKAVSAIERNAFAQARLIGDLLDVARMMKGRFSLSVEPMDLRASAFAALETVRPAAEAKHLDVQVVAPQPVTVLGDEVRLQQVAWNLLANAVKFTPRGGRVTVEVDRVGSRARFRVSDSGEGIEPSFLPHVFEPFRQAVSRRRPAGLGLGLAIVRQIVELHGGTAVADSDGRHQGASFTIMMPYGDDAAAVAKREAAPAASTVGLKALIAEDDEDAAVTLGTALLHRGCDVRTARTAQECLDLFQEFRPDVLVCDIGLPDDDGYSLLRRLRERNRGGPPTPAIAVTALARDEDRSRTLAAGFAAHLSKPIEIDELVETISRVVRQSAP